MIPILRSNYFSLLSPPKTLARNRLMVRKRAGSRTGRSFAVGHRRTVPCGRLPVLEPLLTIEKPDSIGCQKSRQWEPGRTHSVFVGLSGPSPLIVEYATSSTLSHRTHSDQGPSRIHFWVISEKNNADLSKCCPRSSTLDHAANAPFSRI